MNLSAVVMGTLFSPRSTIHYVISHFPLHKTNMIIIMDLYCTFLDTQKALYGSHYSITPYLHVSGGKIPL